MIRSVQYAKYDALVKKIKKSRKKATVFLICALVLIIALSIPLSLDIPNVISFHSTGIGIGKAIILAVVSIVAYLIVIGKTTNTVNSTMSKECDPEKHLVLSSSVFKGSNLDGAYASSLIYLGEYEEAIPYANSLIDSGKRTFVLFGHFHKFRCAFFMGDYELACAIEKDFSKALAEARISNRGVKEVFDRVGIALRFMLALMTDDKEAQKELFPSLNPWISSLSLQGFIEYLKGISAYGQGDMEDALYRLKFVTENCKKTVLATYAQDYLSKIAVNKKDG